AFGRHHTKLSLRHMIAHLDGHSLVLVSFGSCKTTPSADADGGLPSLPSRACGGALARGALRLPRGAYARSLSSAPAARRGPMDPASEVGICARVARKFCRGPES